MGKKKESLSFDDAMWLADSMDLPDGAFWAMAHELAGIEYGAGFDLLAEQSLGTEPEEKRHICAVCGKAFSTRGGQRQHRRDRHGAKS